jgi:hypothetical protein
MTPSDFDGKEGVDGSSPSEGFFEAPAQRAFFAFRAGSASDLVGRFWGAAPWNGSTAGAVPVTAGRLH